MSDSIVAVVMLVYDSVRCIQEECAGMKESSDCVSAPSSARMGCVECQVDTGGVFAKWSLRLQCRWRWERMRGSRVGQNRGLSRGFPKFAWSWLMILMTSCGSGSGRRCALRR